MPDNLEIFIDQHRPEFDNLRAPADLWNEIDSRIGSESIVSAKSKLLSKLIYFGLSVALLMITGIYFVSQNSNTTASEAFNAEANGWTMKDPVASMDAPDNKADEINSNHDKVNAQDLSSDHPADKNELKFSVSGSDMKSDSTGFNKTDTSTFRVSAQVSDQTFRITDMYQTFPDKLFWRTINESLKFPFFVEQLRWNRWIKVGRLPAWAKPKKHRYMLRVPTHFGENTFRIVQVNDTNAYVFISSQIKWTSDKAKVRYSIKKKHKEIRFSQYTFYEVYGAAGTLIKEGRGTMVSFANLGPGVYTLNYDNSIATIKLN